MKKVIIEERKNNTFTNLVFTAILGFVFYFLFLPAFNLTSMGFWGLIFLLFGILFISLGIVGIYIYNIHVETKCRPIYIKKELLVGGKVYEK